MIQATEKDALVCPDGNEASNGFCTKGIKAGILSKGRILATHGLITNVTPTQIKKEIKATLPILRVLERDNKMIIIKIQINPTLPRDVIKIHNGFNKPQRILSWIHNKIEPSIFNPIPSQS